ncbi:HNH endonuclease [Candidatus Methylomirabilis sp.]|uniref:HTH domain-containing protein n=1 Tax=Candidatus Methylomirabilis sp. TaxID=2032687 RepID=UPI00307603B3
MTKPKRKYSLKTLKVLFALSGNQCAHPDCTNALIEPPTEESGALVIAHICHIYAVSEDGPRGKSGLTEKELNSPENLILFCPTHHVIIDGQHETYPADMLKEWKQAHESEIQKRLSADLESVQPDVFSHPYFPTALVDQKIEDDVDILRKSRFFVEFDGVRSSLALARRLVDGELSGGTDAVRSRALAWCARFLSPTEKLDKAEEYLKLAKGLGTGPEVEIAHAFICSQKGDKNAALSALASIDAPISRSAALMVVAYHEGPERAVDWLKTAGIDVTDLDPDGKYFLLTRQLDLARWEAARECLDALTDEDLREAPVLNHMEAIIYLLSTVPNELRAVVLNQLPFEAARFPLASEAAAINARREAHRHFINAAQVAQQLNCPGAATIDDEYALWLELKDPDESDKGRQRLEAKLRDPKSALRLVHLGLQFGIMLDLEAVEREIERQIALHGGITHDAAIARFALAFTQKTPEDVANYVARHRDELAKFLDKKSLQFLQIEMLSRAGLSERANECLDILVEEGLSEAEENRLRRIIAEAEGTDPVEARKEHFKKTDSLGDLVSLVGELETRGDWDGICEYGQILFERTRSLHDAERLANSLSNTQKNERLVAFLEANRALLAQSKNLQMLYCWSLYREGALLEARSELAKLSDDRDNANYRALQINLGISLGDWISLSAFVANECLEKDKRSAQDLVGDARLALRLGSPHAKELIFAAAGKGNDDAGVLAAAYFLASSAGWEDDPEVFKWLHDAAARSGDDGPIQKMTLKDVLDRKPEWDRRESETWQLLSRGDIPMFLAARSLNKSLIDLMLFPALANLSENDPRRRGAVPAYSGKRQPTPFNTAEVVGMDATALLTLSFLNLLDEALDAFDTVHVPHSTLKWLFEEGQKATFHQPSRIRAAHHLRHLLATNVLEKLIPSTVPDNDLSAQVGEELALLIAEAEKVTDDDDAQRIVVRSSPVHRVASLMEEEADLTAHAAVLSSCQSVVDKLREKGQITAKEEKKARAYLQLHEKPWPNQPEVADGAVLYLDDLAISYFLHLGILEKLHAAGFRPIASTRKVSEANELISYESISDKVIDAIERIRSAINSRIESGKIKVGRRPNLDEPEEQSISGHPTVGVIALARDCDAIIADDRFLNQHANIDDGSAQAPIFSTLDLLDALVSTGSITPEDRLEYRALLRRAGYFFVPVSDDELAGHLNASTVKDNKVIETAELKAIRENILRVRMSAWLQLPKEAPWLDMSLKVFIRVLKGLWRADADLSSVRARSDWIMDQVDVRGWAQSLGGETGDNIVKTGRGAHILMVLTPPADAPRDVKDGYWSWVEDRVLAPIKEQYPDLYSWIVDWLRRQIAEMADMDLTEGGAK